MLGRALWATLVTQGERDPPAQQCSSLSARHLAQGLERDRVAVTLHPGWALLTLPQQGRIRPGQGQLAPEPALPAQIAGETLNQFAPPQRWLWGPRSARGKRWAQAAGVGPPQWGRGFCQRVPALTWVRHSALGGQLSQEDAKGPDVRLDGKPAVQSSFGGRPLDGELCAWMERWDEGLLPAPRCPGVHGAASASRTPVQPGPRDGSRCNAHPWGPGTSGHCSGAVCLGRVPAAPGSAGHAPCRAVYSLSSMRRAKPKSATLHTRFSPTRMLAARRSRWT